MGGYIEYEGKTFGKLKVIGRTGFTSRSAGTELLVRNIGTHKVKTITSGNLRHGHRGDKKFPQSLCSRNATGYAGVTINAGRYFSQIGIDGINYGLGHFNNGEEAHQAYEDAKSNYLKHGVLPVPIPRSSSLNTSGVTGVYRRGKKWQAAITVKGKQISLGYFETKDEAIAARKAAEHKYLGGN